MDEPSRQTRLEAVLDGYFDVRTSAIVDRAQSLLSLDDLDDQAVTDEMFEDLIELVERRYGRDDPGWHDATRSFLRAEWERQLDATRAFYASFED